MKPCSPNHIRPVSKTSLSPKLPRKFFGDFPGSSFTVELYINPGVPRKFPRLPRKFPRLPRRFPRLPRRSAISLGSLTPSRDSQKLSLSHGRGGYRRESVLKGPKIDKHQKCPPGLKFSSEIENFKQATQQTPTFCGEF